MGAYVFDVERYMGQHWQKPSLRLMIADYVMNLLSLIRRLEIRTGRVFKLPVLPFVHMKKKKWKILNGRLYVRKENQQDATI